MKSYIISVAAAAVISAVMNMLAPRGWAKYVGIVTGLAVAACIGTPILRLAGEDLFGGISLKTESAARDGAEILDEEIKKELAARVESDAKIRLKREFGADCEVEAVIVSDGRGVVKGIGELTVTGGHLDNAAFARLREVYGAERVNYAGYKKGNSENPKERE